MNFFQIIRKSNQNELDSISSSSIYDFAAEKLEPKTFAESNKTIFQVSNFFSIAYHFISFVLAVIGGWYYSLSLNSLLYQIVFLILCTLLLCVIELVKSSSSNTVFAQMIRKDKVTKISLVILVSTTIFSFVTSTYSAKVATYQISTTSTFSNIDSLQNAKIDSVNGLYSVQIQSIESSLKASQNTLNSTKNKWLRIATNKDIQDSQTSLTNVLERKEKAINQITTSTLKDTTKASSTGLEIAYFIACIIALFEVFNLCSYYYYFYYLRGCVLENNLSTAAPAAPAITHSLDERTLDDGTLDDTKKAVKTPVQDITPNEYIIPKKPYQNITPPPKKQIGFQYSSNSLNDSTLEEPKEPTKIVVKSSVQDKIKIGTCKHCESEFVKKSVRHVFCQTSCRMQNWEQEKGAKITLKSSKK